MTLTLLTNVIFVTIMSRTCCVFKTLISVTTRHKMNHFVKEFVLRLIKWLSTIDVQCMTFVNQNLMSWIHL